VLLLDQLGRFKAWDEEKPQLTICAQSFAFLPFASVFDPSLQHHEDNFAVGFSDDCGDISGRNLSPLLAIVQMLSDMAYLYFSPLILRLVPKTMMLLRTVPSPELVRNI
jgi:hypothetical protein